MNILKKIAIFILLAITGISCANNNGGNANGEVQPAVQLSPFYTFKQPTPKLDAAEYGYKAKKKRDWLPFVPFVGGGGIDEFEPGDLVVKPESATMVSTQHNIGQVYDGKKISLVDLSNLTAQLKFVYLAKDSYVREGPGTHAILAYNGATYVKGAKLVEVLSTGRWTLTATSSGVRLGWIRSNILQNAFVATEQMVITSYKVVVPKSVNGGKLRKRSGPGINYDEVGIIRSGQVVCAFEERNGWIKISSSREVWLKASYLQRGESRSMDKWKATSRYSTN